jgi:hypothetical protein
LERDIKDTDYVEIASSLNYEFHAKGKNVFEYGTYMRFYLTNIYVGSTGDKFYVIIKGGCTVLTPIHKMDNFQENYDAYIKLADEKKDELREVQAQID